MYWNVCCNWYTPSTEAISAETEVPDLMTGSNPGPCHVAFHLSRGPCGQTVGQEEGWVLRQGNRSEEINAWLQQARHRHQHAAKASEGHRQRRPRGDAAKPPSELGTSVPSATGRARSPNNLYCVCAEGEAAWSSRAWVSLVEQKHQSEQLASPPN